MQGEKKKKEEEERRWWMGGNEGSRGVGAEGRGLRGGTNFSRKRHAKYVFCFLRKLPIYLLSCLLLLGNFAISKRWA